jgi:hypothetical protein
MTIPEMAALARQAWKEANPEVYQALVAAGQLEAETEASAQLTKREMDTLMYKGIMTEADAWEASRQLFIFKTADQLQRQYRDFIDQD